MEAHVDVAAALGHRVIVLHRLAQALALLLHAERHHQRVAAERRRARAALEVVGHDDAGAARLGEMHVAVDAARQHQPPARVDHLVGRAQVLAERHDPAAADADVAGDRVAGVGHASAADDGVELAHASPTPPDISTFARSSPPLRRALASVASPVGRGREAMTYGRVASLRGSPIAQWRGRKSFGRTGEGRTVLQP